jgi:transposase, IS6 family
VITTPLDGSSPERCATAKSCHGDHHRPRLGLSSVLDKLLPGACHLTGRYANNRIEADHAPSHGTAGSDARSQAGPFCACAGPRSRFLQNVRRGHYELATEVPLHLRLATAFQELASAL